MIASELDRFLERVGTDPEFNPSFAALPYSAQCVVRATRILMTHP
jgi:hypothetical protein